jgi:hypothetical protein
LVGQSARAQRPSSWLGADLGAGLFVPASAWGASTTTSAKLETAAMVSGGITLGSGPIGVHLSGVVGVGSGEDFRPRSDCTVACAASSMKAGRFVGAAADLVGRRERGRLRGQLGLGVGIRRYDFGEQAFTSPCLPGALCDDPFRVARTNAVFHLSSAIGIRLTSLTLIGSLQDYIGARSRPGHQHDLIVTVGLGLGSFWRAPLPGRGADPRN